MAAEVYALGDNTYASESDLTGLGGEFSVPAAWSTAEQQSVLLRASKRIDSVTGQHFGYSALTLMLDGSNTWLLRTNTALSWRLVDITSIHRREKFEDAWTASTVVQIASTKFTITQSRRAVKRTDGDVWLPGIKNYRLIGRFGRKYVPEPIRWACVLLAREEITPGSATRYEQYQSETFGDGYGYTRKSAPQDAVRAAVSTGIPTVDAILAKYISNRPMMMVPGVS